MRGCGQYQANEGDMNKTHGSYKLVTNFKQSCKGATLCGLEKLLLESMS